MDAKWDAGEDPEKPERDGQDICQLYRYFLCFRAFYKNNTKFQRKRGVRGPLGQPLNPPLGVDGCCCSLLFSILARKSALRHFVLACVSLVERRREKLTYCCLVCSSVDEKKNRRSKVLKMMQRRNKPIATPRGKGYKERKISRQQERPVVTQRKQYHETNERHDLKTWNLRHEDGRQ